MDGCLSEHTKEDLPPIAHWWCVEHAGRGPPPGRGVQVDPRNNLVASMSPLTRQLSKQLGVAHGAGSFPASQ